MASQVHVNVRRIIEDCLERGALFGINRHYKHAEEAPDLMERERMATEVVENQMRELGEYLMFEEWWGDFAESTDGLDSPDR